jgi:hypothetical protein
LGQREVLQHPECCLDTDRRTFLRQQQRISPCQRRPTQFLNKALKKGLLTGGNDPVNLKWADTTAGKRQNIN